MASRQSSSARLSRSDSLKTIGRFAGYLPLSSIGTLGECELYLGERPSPLRTRYVLLKHLPRSRRGYLALRERMLEEARLADRLSHPNFLPFLDRDEDDSGSTLVYESPNALDLSRALSELTRRQEALPFGVIAHLVREVARATDYAHREHALLLRELRPDTVLVAPDGRVFIATFRLELGHPEHEPILEEASHLAPECLSRSEYGTASDVYALGVLLFTLLTGKSPPAGKPVPLDDLEAEGVPDQLIATVARATHPAKIERQKNAAKLLAELDAWLTSQRAAISQEIVSAFFSRHLR